jgi:hypothetical protein
MKAWEIDLLNNVITIYNACIEFLVKSILLVFFI